MDRKKSPRYPSISLEEAIERSKVVFAKERKNPATREIIARALGYAGISGKSAGILGSLRQYGLLVGHDKGLRISDDAVDLIHAPISSNEYKSALMKAAFAPKLFSEIRDHFTSGAPSDENLRYFLIRKGFAHDAKEQAAKAYRDTIAFLEKNVPLAAESLSGTDNAGTQISASVKDSHSVLVGQSTELPRSVVSNSHFERTVLAPGVSVELVFSREPTFEDFEALSDYVEFRIKRLRRTAPESS